MADLGTVMRLSVVIEWENVLLAEADRCRRMLRELGTQLIDLRKGEPALSNGFVRIQFPVEILVMYDPRDVDQTSVEATVNQHLAGDTAIRICRLIPVPGGTYYVLKNEGARHATGDLLLMLDTDVVPQAGWLRALLEPFTEPQVQLVGGQAYLATDSTIAKALALSWFFPLRQAKRTLGPKTHFFANNVAIRRSLLLEHPFPDVPGANRGACKVLAQQLLELGTPPYINTAAEVEHPPPYGFRALIRRALAHGRDELFLARSASPGKDGLAYAVGRTCWMWARGIRNLMFRRQQVGLSMVELPAALATVTTYYACYLVGDLGARMLPTYMQTHFQV
jgi:Glycosyl transferase family 2